MDKLEFNKIRILLDNLEDQDEMSEQAKQIIAKHGFRDTISDKEILTWFVAGTELENWQNLYLLDRSIPYLRDKQRPEWHKRMLYFPGTYIMEERTLLNKTISFRGNRVKFLYTRGSGDHANVHTGGGTASADFYFWIDNKPVFVEYKFASNKKYNTIEDVKKAYANKKHLHKSKVVVAFLETENTFYIIDYDNNKVEKLDIKAPVAYIGSDDIEKFEDPLR